MTASSSTTKRNANPNAKAHATAIELVRLEERITKLEEELSLGNFGMEISKLQGRIGGAYASIAALNKAIARLAANEPLQDHTDHDFPRHEALKAASDFLALADNCLAKAHMLEYGPVRQNLRRSRNSLRQYT